MDVDEVDELDVAFPPDAGFRGTPVLDGMTPVDPEALAVLVTVALDVTFEAPETEPDVVAEAETEEEPDFDAEAVAERPTSVWWGPEQDVKLSERRRTDCLASR